MRRSSFILALAVATTVISLLLAGIVYTYITMRRYSTASFAFGGAIICIYYTSIYFRDWRTARVIERQKERRETQM
jgi:hypothetical protein